jgi:pilus assembly protein CpaF
MDDSLTEIMILGSERIYVERKGKIGLTDQRFESDAAVLDLIQRIVKSVGRHIDEESPLCDARLPDGSRVHAAIPPVTLDGPVLTIRKFARDTIQADDLVEYASINQFGVDLLRTAVMARANIVIAGGTGAGKTTLLNICSGFIPKDERIVSIEDAAELHLHQDHVVRMEARPPRADGRGQIAIRELVINALRMRPDRLVVGECRGGEALDMLVAMNTGHDGSMTTIHANGARDTISRLETMVLMAGIDMPLKAIRQMIVAAIQLIVFVSRLQDGSRKVTAITEVAGMEGEIVTTQDVFRFVPRGAHAQTGRIEGSFEPTGVRPLLMDRCAQRGITPPQALIRQFGIPRRRSA